MILSVRVRHAAWERDGSVMPQHVPIERVERGIVDVGRKHTLAQIIEHDHARHPGQPPKGFLMQLGPDLGTGAEHREVSVGVRNSEKMALRCPVMPIADGLLG